MEKNNDNSMVNNGCKLNKARDNKLQNLGLYICIPAVALAMVFTLLDTYKKFSSAFNILFVVVAAIGLVISNFLAMKNYNECGCFNCKSAANRKKSGIIIYAVVAVILIAVFIIRQFDLLNVQVK